MLGLKASSFKSWTSELNLFRSQRILFCRRLPRAMPRSSPSPLLAITSPPPPPKQKKCCISHPGPLPFPFPPVAYHLFPSSLRQLRHPTPCPTPLTSSHAPLPNPTSHTSAPRSPIPSFVAGRNLSLDTGRVKGAGLYLVRDTGHDRD